MATIKFGGGITQMSGSLAGTVFARNRYGNYTRPRTKPVNPRSSNQIVIRSALSYFTQRWHDTLSAAQRTGWNSYAAAVAMKNRLGETIYLTGFNMYLRTNIVRKQLGQTTCDDGPTVISLPEKDTALVLTASVAANKLSIAWTDDLPWTGIADSVMGIWMGVPQLATRNFFNGPWRLAGSWPGDDETNPYLMAAPFTLILGQKIWAYSRISTGPTDSRLSEPMVMSCVVSA